ncbi:hypothetical protein Tco_1107019 [Tanacetum coccineum]
MAQMGFCDKHNMVAFLQKPSGSEEFHQIVDFLADSHIRYALTANPTIYVSLVEQFWQTATVETVNDGEQQITVTVDGHKFAITEASVRRHLQLADVDGLSSLPNTEIFEQLSLMGQSGSMIRYQALKKKPVTIAQATKNMKIYLKNMAGYKMTNFKGMRYEQIRPIFEKEYNKVQTLFQKNPEVGNTRKEGIQRSTTPGKL